MPDLRTLGATSNRVRFTLKDKTTGQGKTGLSISTTGLIISTIADNEASATAYTQAGSTIETIATLGTFATPTATKCRFKEIDSTNHKGLYEFQFADARFAVSSAKRLVISVNDAESTILDADYEIEFTTDLVAAIAVPTTSQIRTAFFTDLLSSSDFATAGSFGKAMKNLSAGTTDVIYSSVLPSQAGITTSQVKLDTGASAVDNAYQWDVFTATAGTGQGSRICLSYVGATRVATLAKAWTVAPVATDTVEITPTASVQVAAYVTGQDPATLVLDVAQASHDTAGTIGHDIGLVASGVTVAGTVDANIVSSAINVPAILADGVAHGGTPGSSTATLAIARCAIYNSTSDAAFDVFNSAGNAAKFRVTGASSNAFVASAGPDAVSAFYVENYNPSFPSCNIYSDQNTGLEIDGGVDASAVVFHSFGSAPTIKIQSAGSGGDLIQMLTTAGNGISILAAGTGKKALLLSGDAATDSFAIAAGAGSPIDVFDAQARVTGSATLLDATPTTDPAGVASTFPQMLVQVWRYCFKRKTKAVSGLTIKTYADDNTTVNTTQPYTDDGAGNQSQGPAV